MEPRSQDLWVQKSRVFYKLWGRYMLWFILIKRKASGGSNPFEFVRSHRHNCHPLLSFFFFVSSLSPNASISPPFTPLFEGIKKTLCNCFGKKNNIFFILDCSFLFFCYKPFKHLWMIIVVAERSQNELLLLFISLIYIRVIK